MKHKFRSVRPRKHLTGLWGGGWLTLRKFEANGRGTGKVMREVGFDADSEPQVHKREGTVGQRREKGDDSEKQLLTAGGFFTKSRERRLEDSRQTKGDKSGGGKSSSKKFKKAKLE